MDKESMIRVLEREVIDHRIRITDLKEEGYDQTNKEVKKDLDKKISSLWETIRSKERRIYEIKKSLEI